MMFRQQLSEYQIVAGLPVPTVMSHIIQKGQKQIKRILTFENIAVNDTGNDAMYHLEIVE